MTDTDDDLRTRIAAVIRREVPCHPPAADRIADAVIRELGLANACQSGCMWQIPRHVEDMTPEQRQKLGLTYDCRYCGGWGPEHE